MIVEELYDALIEAGASQEKAKAASRAVADMEGHFANIQKDIGGLDRRVSELDGKISELDGKISELDGKISALRSEFEGNFRLHNWMLATNLAFIVAVFFKVFSR